MARLIVFTPKVCDGYHYWKTQDKKTLKRTTMLIEASAREPFTGIAKPKPLKGDLTGFWSRRIDDVNRLVYQVTEQELQIEACRYHYG